MLSLRSRQIVESFAGQLGLPLRPAADGSFTFVFAETGRLSVTASRDGRRVFVSLARRPVRMEVGVLSNALTFTGPEPATNRLVQAGLSADDELHLSIGLDEDGLDLPLLDASFQRLIALHGALR